MRFNTIGYCFKQGFKNIWRNKLFSLASMATMAACIFMFGIFFCMVQNFQHFVREAEEGVAVTVLFDEGTTEDEILEIGQGLTKRDGVSEVVYVSADEAWKSYQEKYFEGNPEVAEAFVDDNPLANSSNLEKSKPFRFGYIHADRFQQTGQLCVGCNYRAAAGSSDLPDQ